MKRIGLIIIIILFCLSCYGQPLQTMKIMGIRSGVMPAPISTVDISETIKMTPNKDLPIVMASILSSIDISLPLEKIKIIGNAIMKQIANMSIQEVMSIFVKLDKISFENLITLIRLYDWQFEQRHDNVALMIAIQKGDYVTVRNIASKYIPPDKVQKLIDYVEGKNPAVLQKIDWVLWKDAYDITQEIPHGDVFLLIKELRIGYEELYDPYFSNHQGKTMVVFSWDIVRENYIRQLMFQFGLRYENKIYGVMPNYGGENNIDFKGDYTIWHEPIGTVINWFKSNTSLPVGLTVCQVRDDSDAKFHEVMKDLDYDFVYLWGLHDFNYEFGIEFGEANRWANGRPIILGGFFGNRENPTGMLPDAILTDYSYKFPSFMAQRKSEGWLGIHIIGERWNTILAKCKERGNL